MKKKRKIYERVDGIYYNNVEQAVSELGIPKYLVMKSLQNDLLIKWNNYKYYFVYID